MTWVNPPAAITAARDMIAATASATAAGYVSANFHYPSALMESDDATTPDTRPLCVLGEESAERVPYAEMGVAGLPVGRVVAYFYSDTLTTGQLETLADNIAYDLNTATDGLGNVNASRIRASEPTPGQDAADATTGDTKASFSVIALLITYGLKA